MNDNVTVVYDGPAEGLMSTAEATAQGESLDVLNGLTSLGCAPRQSPTGYSATCPVEGGTRRWVVVQHVTDGVSVSCGHCGLDLRRRAVEASRRPSVAGHKPLFGSHRSGPIVDDDRMAWTTSTDNEDLCGSRSRQTLHRSGRGFSRSPLRCDTWDEERCGTRQADEALSSLRAGVGNRPVYVVDLRSQTKTERNRVSAAVGRAHGAAVRIERKDGSVRYLASGVFGLPSSGVWISGGDADQAMIDGLRLPGVGRVDWSGSWRARRRHDREANATEPPVMSVVASDERFKQVFADVAQQAEARWGVKPTVRYIAPPIDLDEFAAMLDEALHPDRPQDTATPVSDHPSVEEQGAIGDCCCEPSHGGGSVTPSEGGSVTPSVNGLRAASDPLLRAIQAELSDRLQEGAASATER